MPGNGREAKGSLVYRNEDLDPIRCKARFAQAAIDALRWIGLDWDEEPDIEDPHSPYNQSERRAYYRAAWRKLRDDGWIYPCAQSRKDIARASVAPHAEDETAEAIFTVEPKKSS